MIEGLAQTLWGAQVHGLELGIADMPFEVGGVMLSQFDLFAAGTAGVLVLVLGLLFNNTRLGLALRARGRRSAGGARRSASICRRVWARRLGGGRAWWRWSRACCGARASACSSRCR